MQHEKLLTTVLINGNLKIEGTIDKAIQKLIDIKIAASRNYQNIRIETKECRHGGPDFFVITGQRLETDREFEYRKTQERIQDDIKRMREEQKKKNES